MRIQYCHEILNLSWYFEIPIKLKFFIELMVKIKKIKKKKRKKKHLIVFVGLPQCVFWVLSFCIKIATSLLNILFWIHGICLDQRYILF